MKAANDKGGLTLAERVCTVCWTIFKPTHQRQKYCSGECRFLAWLQKNGIPVWECWYCKQQHFTRPESACECTQQTPVFALKFVRKGRNKNACDRTQADAVGNRTAVTQPVTSVDEINKESMP